MWILLLLFAIKGSEWYTTSQHDASCWSILAAGRWSLLFFQRGRIVLEDREWIPQGTSVPNYSRRASGRLQNSWSPLSSERPRREISVHMSKESFKWVFGGCRRANLEEARDYSHGFLSHRRGSWRKTSFRVSFSQGWVASLHFWFGETCWSVPDLSGAGSSWGGGSPL